jgi:hypothetical protein
LKILPDKADSLSTVLSVQSVQVRINKTNSRSVYLEAKPAIVNLHMIETELALAGLGKAKSSLLKIDHSGLEVWVKWYSSCFVSLKL